jgi:hypothetical protein
MGRKRGDIRHLVAIGTFVTLVLFGGIQAAQAATFGKTAVGGTNDNSYALRLGATKFTSPADAGTLTNLSVYTTNATGPDVCVAIYDDAAGYPGTKIAQACGGSGSGWRTYAVAAALSPNTVYWLTFLDDDGGYTYRYDAGAANQFVKSNSGSYPTLPATFPGGGTFYSREFSIYATYTPIDICPRPPIPESVLYGNVSTRPMSIQGPPSPSIFPERVRIQSSPVPLFRLLLLK